MRKWKIQVLGKIIDVEEVEMNYFTDSDNQKYGAVDCRLGKIWIADEQNRDQKIETILHEILHIFADEFKIEMEEEDIQRIALAFYLLCKENGISLGKLLSGGHNGNKTKRV